MKKEIAAKNSLTIDDFHIGKEGEFILYDSFHEPIETVRGRIVELMEGEAFLYAILETERGMRPARLCPNAISQGVKSFMAKANPNKQTDS